jgi:hypothetical protein
MIVTFDKAVEGKRMRMLCAMEPGKLRHSTSPEESKALVELKRQGYLLGKSGRPPWGGYVMTPEGEHLSAVLKALGVEAE